LILKKEIENISVQKGVAKSTIDKDWVLGHFIDAIFSIPECRKDLIFMGGTCLKKCRFPDYRFSENLDFTSVNPDFNLSKTLLNRIVKIVTERTEIPLFIKELKELKFEGNRTGFAAVVKFWGADHPKNQPPPPPARWTSSIKIEIILYEKMLFDPEYLEVIHEYSDSLSEAAKAIPCYSMKEVLAEKLRALIQRSYTAPRDFYDIWYLSNYGTELNWNAIVAAFLQKMKSKDLEFTGVDQMINPENDKRLKAAWQNSLVHQVKQEFLPEYESVRDELKGLLDELFGSIPN
jgi:predicted nucleotidyltransferase component of viral defense system